MYIFFLICPFLFGEYPLIKELTLQDPLFRQHQEDVARFYESTKRGNPLPPLVLYRYIPRKDDTLFTLAARFNLPYESIGTLNSMERSTSPLGKGPVYIPNQAGLFLAESPSNEMERILRSWRSMEGNPIVVNEKIFRYIPGERFHPVERAFFLNILFVFPLKTGVVSSRYGNRVSPISGEVHFHSGIDLAAPRGTPVFAAREGKVIENGFDPVLGSYIIVEHEGTYQTLYGHLETKIIQLNQFVDSGMMIGTVGMTGATTGPHLHFEVRRKGQLVNPEPLLPRRIEPKP